MFHIFVFELSHFPAIRADGRLTCLHFVSCISDRIRDQLPAAQSGSVGFSNFVIDTIFGIRAYAVRTHILAPPSTGAY